MEPRTKELQDRAAQVQRQLLNDGLPIVKRRGELCSNASLGGTPFLEDYQGCGSGTAYVDGDNRLRAFHYGYAMPEGWVPPVGLQPHRVEMSCTQVCF